MTQSNRAFFKRTVRLVLGIDKNAEKDIITGQKSINNDVLVSLWRFGMFDIQEELKKLPNCPGVYIMHDEKDAIIYVGKAVNLHNRVRSYFRKNIGRGPPDR